MSRFPDPARKIIAVMLLVPFVIGGFVLGVFFFAVALAIVTATVAAVLLRTWWLRRKPRTSATSVVLEGEFQVVSPKDPREESRP